MSKIGVSLKLNLTAVDVARLFQGAKGQYLDCTVFIDLDQLDERGNSGMVTQDVSKEERAQQVRGNILGNCKVFWSDTLPVPQPMNQAPSQQAPQQATWQQQPAPQQAPPMQQAPVQQQAPQQAPAPQNGGGTGYVQPQQQPAQQAPQQSEWGNQGEQKAQF